MTQRSRFWDGELIGDALIEAPYDAPTELATVLMNLSLTAEMTNKGGISSNVDNELAVSGGASPLSVATGEAWVWGTWFDSDAIESIVVPLPTVATRIDRIVLRKVWADQEARLYRIEGIEGGAAPALVQVAGTTWDIPLAQVSITTGGVITLTDEREFYDDIIETIWVGTFEHYEALNHAVLGAGYLALSATDSPSTIFGNLIVPYNYRSNMTVQAIGIVVGGVAGQEVHLEHSATRHRVGEGVVACGNYAGPHNVLTPPDTTVSLCSFTLTGIQAGDAVHLQIQRRYDDPLDTCLQTLAIYAWCVTYQAKRYIP